MENLQVQGVSCLRENQLGDVDIPFGLLLSVANRSFGFKIALALKLKNFSFRIACTTLIGMRKGLDTFVEVKIDINRVNFDTLLSSLSLIKNAPRWR